MHPTLWSLVAASTLSTTSPRMPAGGGSAFDPSTYLHERAEADATEAQILTEHGIYRVNGRRFHRLVSRDGEVFLPGDGEVPDLQEEFALCRQHLPLTNEVVKIRDGLQVRAKLQALAPRIVPLIRKCQEGRVRGPTMVTKSPDGAYIEVSSKPGSKGPTTAKAGKGPGEDKMQ